MAHSGVHVREKSRGRSIADYWPLVCLILVAGLAALALVRGFGGGDYSMTHLMHAYIGVFLVMFAMLKLFDLQGFMDGFSMYDLFSKVDSRWGYIYPFVELGLGISYLSFAAPRVTYAVTIAVFLFGAAGVLLALRKGLDIACPCMGNILKAPLSTVTLTEDFGMAAMALLLLLKS